MGDWLMDNAERAALYTRDRATPTPAQRRRLRKAANVEASVLATIRRGSRLRKAVERDRRVKVRDEAGVVVGIVRRLRSVR